MPSKPKPSWISEEDGRAKAQAKTTETTNPDAPRLIRKEYAPERKQKAFYMRPCYAEAFEDFIIKQKRSGENVKKTTEIAEEMVKDILHKYGEDTSHLP